MSNLLPSARAFRFNAGNVQYAVDIINTNVLLYVEKPTGWARVINEFAPILADNAAITAAGGPVKFAEQVVVAVNNALRILFGKAVESAKPATDLQGQVLDALRANFKVVTLMDGSTEIQPK